MYALKFNFLFVFLFNCLFFFSAISYCQTHAYLVVEKPGTSNRQLYKTGDDISLKLKSESVYLTGTIELLLDSSMVVEGHAIRLSEIAKIKHRRTGELMPKVVGLSYKLPIAGVLLMLFEGASAEMQGESPLVEENTMVISGALISGGLLLGTVRNKNMHLGKKYRARIVRFDLK
ncbi:MAG: hypothetical protein HKO56_05680 [Bacteroidia bacterium]|nr:hypothetical protein [Bacteroidia bacterium]NNC85777.1 hypothetical protein [Bacteroidia bacterium]NNM16130.1 hypothetical protein [Bacteroidia bacterium]